jgi:hypothetical protein
MQERVRKLFHEAMDMRNELFLQRALSGSTSEEDKLIYEFLEKLGSEYVKLTDELYVLKPFKIFLPGGYLNG